MKILHQIVIVGGGAGGLELATRLGDTLGKKGRARITLVDRERTHIWRPLLHEVAAGTMDIHSHELDYVAQASWHHFTFRKGAMDGIDRASREISIAPTLDENGEILIPRSTVRYDTLLIALGSVTNDFGVPGVAQNASVLDSGAQADHFHEKLINACIRSNFNPAQNRKINIVIVGGGATGVELAAELHNTTRLLPVYGLENIDPSQHIRITVVNSDPRILMGLPEYLSEATMKLLSELGINVINGEQVIEVTPEVIKTKNGLVLDATLTVWAAGIKVPDFMRDIGGLETNRLNQLVVLPTLQTTRDEDIFAFGDCAACPWPGHDKPVPPRAQAAHQQASHLVKTIGRRLRSETPSAFVYRDFGSLISLGEYSAVGNLMGFISGGSIRLEGWFARLMYILLYKLHLLAIHGFLDVLLDTLGRSIKRRSEPRIKLH